MHRLFAPAPLLFALLAGGTLHVRDEVTADGITRVRVHWASGTIRVRPVTTEVTEAGVLAWGPEAPGAFSSRATGGLLSLELGCRLPVPCGGDLELALPPGVALEVDLGEGEVLLERVDGDLTISVGQGRIAAEALGSSDAVLQVAVGEIDASWSTAPERVVLATVRGDVQAALPPAAYHLQGLGGRVDMVGIEDSPEATRTVSVTTVEGHARIARSVPELAAVDEAVPGLAAL
ncbi:MAG: hypothetical protein ABIO70_33660 [Pseudomonadota bacterium]